MATVSIVRRNSPPRTSCIEEHAALVVGEREQFDGCHCAAVSTPHAGLLRSLYTASHRYQSGIVRTSAVSRGGRSADYGSALRNGTPHPAPRTRTTPTHLHSAIPTVYLDGNRSPTFARVRIRCASTGRSSVAALSLTESLSRLCERGRRVTRDCGERSKHLCVLASRSNPTNDVTGNNLGR